MIGGMTEGARTRGRRAGQQRRRVSVVGVLGELLITAGVLVLAFVGWQVWLGDLIMGNQLQQETTELSQEWQDAASEIPPSEAGNPEEPPVMAAPANAQRFAVLIIPRLGADYARPIAEGIGVRDVLNKGNIGHYPSTVMPGAVGNFALASHRMSGGGNFRDIHTLHVGDHVYVETPDGWYEYTFRNIEYVRPSAVDVLNAVPQSDQSTGERYLTMTTCNPFFSTAERLIAFASYDTFYPRGGGAPPEIAGTPAGGVQALGDLGKGAD